MKQREGYEKEKNKKKKKKKYFYELCRNFTNRNYTDNSINQ